MMNYFYYFEKQAIMQKDVPRAETDQFGNFQRTYKHLKRMESCSVCSMKIRKKSLRQWRTVMDR